MYSQNKGAPFGFVEDIRNTVALSHDAEFFVELVGNIELIVRVKARETKHDSSGARNRRPPRTDGSNRIPSPRSGQIDVVIAGVDVYDLGWNTTGLASVIGDLFAAQGRLPSVRGPAPQVPGSLSRG
jgi:hypothetical protein